MIKRTRPYRKFRTAEKGKSKLVSTVNYRPIWDLLKEYINKFPTNNITSRSTIISYIYHQNYIKRYLDINTIDNYIYNLKDVQVLEIISPGKYKKLRDIPIKLTTSQLRKISNKNSWESWFMSIDYI